MAGKWFEKFAVPKKKNNKIVSFLRSMTTGSFYRVSDLHVNDDFADIRNLIRGMRELAKDSQVSTALSYYATDATTPNTNGDIIWATEGDDGNKEAVEIINALFKRWQINKYVRDHILELATIGNLYMPTTDLFRDYGNRAAAEKISLDSNTIQDLGYDIVPSYKLSPEDTLHLWSKGVAKGYIYQPDESDLALGDNTRLIVYPESAIIHFSLGGLLGDYSIDVRNQKGSLEKYDIQFAQPLLESALGPTQTLNLLENASILSSLIKVVRFINVDCGEAEEEEIQDALQEIKDAIEQQLSLNTTTGDTQSFLNPQSPNNLIYLPKINGQDAVSILDLNMKDESENTDKLLNYYQDKKLSVLGIPKEALNFSSSEGLGGAGAVMSQRSALYANSLQRLETAYLSGWTDAINKYFIAKNMSGYVDKFKLHMNPILTEMSTVQFDKRDSAVSQAQAIVELFKGLKIDKKDDYIIALAEILTEAFPQTSAALNKSHIDISLSEEDESGMI